MPRFDAHRFPMGMTALAAVVLAACANPPTPRVVTWVAAAPPAVVPAADSDHDGVPDPIDACPTLPGIPSPVIVQNGCPPPGYYDDGLGTNDRDGDGVADSVDACPEVPGPASPLNRGCPDPPRAEGSVSSTVSPVSSTSGPVRSPAPGSIAVFPDLPPEPRRTPARRSLDESGL